MTRRIAQVYYDLSTLLEGGVPILRSLKALTPGLKAGKIKRVFLEILKDVSEGNSMSDTMAKHPRVFAPLDVSVIKASEMSGNLPQSLLMLSKWYEFCSKVKGVIIAGLLLPAVLLLIAAFVGPFIPYVLGSISQRRYCIEVILILVVFWIPGISLYLLFTFMPTKGHFRRGVDEFLLAIPVIGGPLRSIALSRYCRAFNMLYSAGVPITKCAETACEATNNTAIAARLRGGAKSAQEGRMVSEGFSPSLPAEFIQPWLIGEESGGLDKVTEHMGDVTSERAEFMLGQLGRWLPRIVYGLVSAMILIQIVRGLAALGGAYSSAFGS
ncbi:MAG: type II secretion system F family protein [Planctomycetota bacterium]|jgi:type II secretory pathway component PulF